MKKCTLEKTKVIAIVGATASGKTSYAIDLAKKLDGEVISADSRYVYRELNIGTSKPTSTDMDGIPHHMIDIVNPDFEYSVGLYVKEAKKCITDIVSRGKVPIIAGGTGLYFTVLFDNYKLPEVEPDWELRNKLNIMDNSTLYNLLLGLDSSAPEYNILQEDKKRVIRTIEILKTTGKKLSEVRLKGEEEYDVEWIGLNYDRQTLYDRINNRVDIMMEQGLVNETKNLIKKWGRIHNIVDTIGYREIIGYLDNQMSLNEAVEKLKQNSRRYAKRQMTWFRRNDKIKWNIFPEKMQ
ncbi:tRNA (adenosine(37)-N6)-dimethylallyltransferase MiaA [bacterium]|nr:tRNA (adenosine(37)-N6)-dimethylallyltransferase MiaA [bacterium]